MNPNSKESPFDEIISYLKLFNTALKRNRSFFFHFIKRNIFDITNDLFMNMELILTSILEESQHGRWFRLKYSDNLSDILDKLITLSFSSMELLYVKISFKNDYLEHS